MTDPSSARGRLWMSLEELAQGDDFAARLVDEFPQGAAVWADGLSRRRFLQLAGASIALAGLNGCMRLPDQQIIPFVDQPEKVVPGRSLHFATTLQVHGHPRGVVVTSHEGRPTHVAGNPLHPLSRGAADVWTMASLLDLYDPERLQACRHGGEVAAWESFVREALPWLGDLGTKGGKGLCFLTPPVNSPTELRLIAQVQARFPQARFYVHDSIDSGVADDAVDLAQADVIFALESDFLYDRPDSLALTRAFSARRRGSTTATCNRLYVAEACPTITGAKADHRFAVAPQDQEALAGALLQGLQGGTIPSDPRWPWLGAVVDDLRQHSGKAVVLAGRSLSGSVGRTIVEANQALGGVPVARTPVWIRDAGRLTDLAERLRQGGVETLVILGGNPVYDAPVDFNFVALLGKAGRTIHHTLFANETSSRCEWVLNAAHDLEAWNDARAVDGTASIMQPLIAPLYGGIGRLELLAFFADSVGQAGYGLVRETWQGMTSLAGDGFEAAWRTWLRDGVMPALLPPTPQAFTMPALPPLVPPTEPEVALPPAPPNATWLVLRPSANVWDGRHANNGWLQELADPITKLTWDNAVLMSAAQAKKLGVNDGDGVALKAGGRTVEGPVVVVPGHAENCLSLSLGHGRTEAGSVGSGVGANAYLLRTSERPWQLPLDSVTLTGRTYILARTQEHFRVEGRDLLHVGRIEAEAPVPAPPEPEIPVPSLYPPFPYEGHKWALSIDLNTCTGCNACVIACQSENNIPVVGREQVRMGRSMQWIRLDRYYEGDAEAPRAHFQPVTCMQCEDAPCEVVCPVAATQHDDEGLNVMIYNRCVGTRYCSNNCPYKVRRFNFLFYNADIPESQRLRLNPNVTVRSRGVMEKCTYCVQRIEEARITARVAHRPLRGDDIVTACQAACPAEAIVFGDLNDPESQVSRNRRVPGHYAMLEELNTRPRTTYLEKKINPNPTLDGTAFGSPI